MFHDEVLAQNEPSVELSKNDDFLGNCLPILELQMEVAVPNGLENVDGGISDLLFFGRRN